MKLGFGGSGKPAAKKAVNRRGPIGLPQASWYWSWGGRSLGFRQGTGLFSAEGMEIGRFTGNELYGPDGKYLGETGARGAEAERLVSNVYKQSRMSTRFTPTTTRPRMQREDREPLPLYLGQEDFPTITPGNQTAAAGR